MDHRINYTAPVFANVAGAYCEHISHSFLTSIIVRLVRFVNNVRFSICCIVGPIPRKSVRVDYSDALHYLPQHFYTSGRYHRDKDHFFRSWLSLWIDWGAD